MPFHFHHHNVHLPLTWLVTLKHIKPNVFDFTTHVTLMKGFPWKREHLVLLFFSRELPSNLFCFIKKCSYRSSYVILTLFKNTWYIPELDVCVYVHVDWMISNLNRQWCYRHTVWWDVLANVAEWTNISSVTHCSEGTAHSLLPEYISEWRSVWRNQAWLRMCREVQSLFFW